MPKVYPTGYDHCTSATKWFTMQPPKGDHATLEVGGLIGSETVIVYQEVGGQWVSFGQIIAPAGEIKIPGGSQFMVDARGVASDRMPCPTFRTCTVDGELDDADSAGDAEDPTMIECTITPLTGFEDKATGGSVIAKASAEGVEYLSLGKDGAWTPVAAAGLSATSAREKTSAVTICGGTHTFAELLEAVAGSEVCTLAKMTMEVAAPHVPIGDTGGVTVRGFAHVTWATEAVTDHFNCATLDLFCNVGRVDCVGSSQMEQSVTLDDGVCVTITAVYT